MTALREQGIQEYQGPDFRVEDPLQIQREIIRGRLAGIMSDDHQAQLTLLLHTVTERAKSTFDTATALTTFTLRDYSLGELKANPAILDNLALEYQIAFADDQQWAEGVCCAQCKRKIGTEAISKVVSGETGFCCDSPQLSMVHSREAILANIEGDFGLAEAIPFLKVATAKLDGQDQVLGFMWGCSNGLGGMVDYMIRKYFKGDVASGDVSEEHLEKVAGAVKDRLDNSQFGGSAGWVQVSELAIRKEARMAGLVMLSILGQECRDQLRGGNTSYMFWTFKGSGIYNPITSFGAQSLISFGEMIEGKSDEVLAGSVTTLELEVTASLESIRSRLGPRLEKRAASRQQQLRRLD